MNTYQIQRALSFVEPHTKWVFPVAEWSVQPSLIQLSEREKITMGGVARKGRMHAFWDVDLLQVSLLE